MKVQGVEITEEQLQAGMAVMVGPRFTSHDVRVALSRVGVAEGTRPADYLLERVADRLMQRERKRGRIRAVTNKLWESTSDPSLL